MRTRAWRECAPPFEGVGGRQEGRLTGMREYARHREVFSIHEVFCMLHRRPYSNLCALGLGASVDSTMKVLRILAWRECRRGVHGTTSLSARPVLQRRVGGSNAERLVRGVGVDRAKWKAQSPSDAARGGHSAYPRTPSRPHAGRGCFTRPADRCTGTLSASRHTHTPSRPHARRGCFTRPAARCTGTLSASHDTHYTHNGRSARNGSATRGAVAHGRASSRPFSQKLSEARSKHIIGGDGRFGALHKVAQLHFALGPEMLGP